MNGMGWEWMCQHLNNDLQQMDHHYNNYLMNQIHASSFLQCVNTLWEIGYIYPIYEISSNHNLSVMFGQWLRLVHFMYNHHSPMCRVFFFFFFFFCILIYRTKQLNIISNRVNIGPNVQLHLTHPNDDLCPTVNTCHHLNGSNITENWTQPKSLVINIVFLNGSQSINHIVNHIFFIL